MQTVQDSYLPNGSVDELSASPELLARDNVPLCLDFRGVILLE